MAAIRDGDACRAGAGLRSGLMDDAAATGVDGIDPAQALETALETLAAGFARLPHVPPPLLDARQASVLQEVAERMQDNYPYHHPLYVGQMLKPPHPLARQAYALAQHLNPNNHALDGGRASSRMEREAVAGIAAMIGWERHLGHLCGGGTLANFEALWIGREEYRAHRDAAGGSRGTGHDVPAGGGADGEPAGTVDGAVVASTQAHYTHGRLSRVLGVPFVPVASDAAGRLDVEALHAVLDRRPVATVVATLGTTALGAVDPLDRILRLRDAYGFRVHADAAYGGYFAMAPGLDAATAAAFDALREADSFVVDPHKHGLQPYGCGCVLFRDPAVGVHYRHDSPYTYFTSAALHLGEISLECSRAGAAAVALWATMRALPLERGGAFASMLGACLEAARELYRHCDAHPALAPLQAPALDIVVWAVRAGRASEASALARAVFEAAAARDLHLALVTLPRTLCEPAGAVAAWDEDQLVCLRACVMKPEHRAWMGEIAARLDDAVRAVLAGA
jgi:glutamate/tyrosine decarboxylase-like PLP-dependent enzyme